MALFYMRNTITIDSPDIEIRPIDEDGYAAAVTYQGEDENEVTEVLFTKEEVSQLYDVVFNR